jgi:GNAT superfamily N-acetyltransferase
VSTPRITSVRIVEVTDDAGAVVAPEWLAKAEAVHRQLRTALAPDYAAKMRRVFDDGARMIVAVREGSVVGVAVYRIYENTAAGRLLYVDDLVSDEASRSQGVGRALLGHLEAKGRALDVDVLELDSGTHRLDAHRFYFRERLAISSFHFFKRLR